MTCKYSILKLLLGNMYGQLAIFQECVRAMQPLAWEESCLFMEGIAKTSRKF
jgi:hypothetical protein